MACGWDFSARNGGGPLSRICLATTDGVYRHGRKFVRHGKLSVE
jgi:hypothetical protein